MRITRAAPGPTKTVAVRLLTTAPPVFVTVNETVNTWPSVTVGGAAASATSAPWVTTETGAGNATPL